MVEGESVNARRVYVLDDELQVLEVIELQLTASGFDVLTYSNPESFLSDLPTLSPGVVISDQRMPFEEGLGIQRQLQRRPNEFPLILLSGYPETRVAVEAMRQGAITVLDKPYNMAELLAALETAFQVLQKCARDEKLLPPLLSNGQSYLSRLSRREREVVDLVYQGETNKSIGIQLGISIKTVEKHRGKAMKKMEVNSLAELIRLMDRELPRM